MGHAFGILLAHVGTLHSLRSFRRRLPWALGTTNHEDAMSTVFSGHLIDRSELPNRFPTHAHEPNFWEALGRAVATFGFLEDVLSKAIFALTGTVRYEQSELVRAYEAWLPTLEKALTDPLGNLICTYEHSVRNHTDANVPNLEDLVKKLRNASALRNVICHGFWDKPDAVGATVPSFINRKKEVFSNPIDKQFLDQLQKHTTELACDVIDTVTCMGWQFPGSTGPGEAVWSDQKL